MKVSLGVASLALVANLIAMPGPPRPEGLQKGAADEASAEDLASAAVQSGLGTGVGLIHVLNRDEREREKTQHDLNMQIYCQPAKDPSCGTGGTPPPVQNEDVIPIAGDSSGPVDEIMHEDPAVEAPLSGPSAESLDIFTRPAARAATALEHPVTLMTRRQDGTIEMRVYSAHGLTPDEQQDMLHVAAVLVPVSAEARRSVEQSIASVATPGSGVHVTRLPLRAYCVESRKLAPSAGTMFVWGPEAVQQQFAPMRAVRAVSEFASRRGYLKPQGDADAYGRSITQYAIWTKLEHWDQARFTDEFIKRSREARTLEHKTSTDETDQTLRAMAPQRWKDVQLVTAAADRVEQRLRVTGSGGGQ